MSRLPRKPRVHGPGASTGLHERQEMVLRALVAAYVGQAGPVASTALSHLMPTTLSPASIRNTLGELHELGLVEKAHASAGRIPSAAGLRVFIDHLLEVADLGPHHQRLLEREFEGIEADETAHQASHLLSAHTRQLGFVVTPRVDELRLKSVYLVPVTTRRILAVLVAENGAVIERRIEEVDPISARELERVQAHLAERIEGRTLIGLRRLLESECENLRGEADDLLQRAWKLGLRACEASKAHGADDLVIATRLALLDQPEFSDPERIRGLFSALETNERLIDLLRSIAGMDSDDPSVGLSISLGAELGEPSLRDCALIAVPYGGSGVTSASPGAVMSMRDGERARGGHDDGHDDGQALGVLGVIGPSRMDYGRVIPLVHYCSQLVTRKLLG